MRTTIIALVGFLTSVFVAVAQVPAPTQQEIDKWRKGDQALETTPCKMIVWLLEREDREKTGRTFHQTLGWWGRGFIEGAAYTVDLPGNEGKAMKKVTDFGLSVDVVAAHLAAYCASNPSQTPLAAIQSLLLKALK